MASFTRPLDVNGIKLFKNLMYKDGKAANSVTVSLIKSK